MDRLGIANSLRRSERAASDLKALKNFYYILYENQAYRIDPRNSAGLRWGFDYYLEVLRLMEERHDIAEVTFFLSNDCPRSLPRYGPSVVLLVLCDEWYKYFSYFYDLRCVFKCYTLKPSFVTPSVGPAGQLAAGLQALKKSSDNLHSRIRARLGSRSGFQARPRVYSLPLGYFAKPSDSEPGAQKDIDFFFAGSIEYSTLDGFQLRNFLPPPKLASRRLMANAAEEYLRAHPGSGFLTSTDGFLASVANSEDYWPLLRRAKIALCPRGGVPETYRFFEAAAAGCAIISEALPRAWYYDGHPAIIIRNWKQLSSVLEMLLSNKERIQELAGRSRQYWSRIVSESVIMEYMVQRVKSDSLKGPMFL